MPSKLERASAAVTGLSATASSSTTARIPYGSVAGGMVFVTSVSGATKISWYAAIGSEAAGVPVYSDGSAVETAIASSRAYPIPDACFGAAFLVPVLDAGTAVLGISLKG